MANGQSLEFRVDRLMANGKYLSDEIGMEQARKYGLSHEYEFARSRGYDIIEALEDWDLLDDDFRTRYKDYELPREKTFAQGARDFLSRIFTLREKGIGN